MRRRGEGRKKKERKERRGGGVVGEGWLKREASSKLKGIPKEMHSASQGPLGINSRLKKCNFGIAPVCMPFEPLIVWDSLGDVPLFIFFADQGIWSRL